MADRQDTSVALADMSRTCVGLGRWLVLVLIAALLPMQAHVQTAGAYTCTRAQILAKTCEPLINGEPAVVTPVATAPVQPTPPAVKLPPGGGAIRPPSPPSITIDYRVCPRGIDLHLWSASDMFSECTGTMEGVEFYLAWDDAITRSYWTDAASRIVAPREGRWITIGQVSHLPGSWRDVCLQSDLFGGASPIGFAEAYWPYSFSYTIPEGYSLSCTWYVSYPAGPPV